MEFESKQYFVIVDEVKGGYWDRINKRFRGILFATEYVGNSVSDIERIIIDDPDIKKGFYSVKKIIQKSKKRII